MGIFKNGVYRITFCKIWYPDISGGHKEVSNYALLEAITQVKKLYEFKVIYTDLESCNACEVHIRCKKCDAYSIFTEYCKCMNKYIKNVVFKFEKSVLRI